MRAGSVHAHSSSAFRWIYDKESNTCNLCHCSSFPAPICSEPAESCCCASENPSALGLPGRAREGEQWKGWWQSCCQGLLHKELQSHCGRTAGLGDKGNAWTKTKAETSELPVCCRGHSVQGMPAFSRKTHGKFTINLTRRNMEHHKAEEWAQTLLTCSAPWYMEAELDWNFNSSCNSPQIIITSFIKMKVLHIISAPRTERIWMKLSH